MIKFYNINLEKTRFYKGHSLLSLMIAVSLASMLLFILMQFYNHIQQHSKLSIWQLELQQEMHNAMQLISKDIRRAGFQFKTSKIDLSNFPLFHYKGQHWNIAKANGEANNSCLVFFYDVDMNGCLGKHKNAICVVNEQNKTTQIENELLGYRLKNHQIQSKSPYKTKTNPHCVAKQCAHYLEHTACNNGRSGLAVRINRVVYSYLRKYCNEHA